MLYAQIISHIFTAEIGKVGKIPNTRLYYVMFCIVVKREQTVIG